MKNEIAEIIRKNITTYQKWGEIARCAGSSEAAAEIIAEIDRIGKEYLGELEDKYKLLSSGNHIDYTTDDKNIGIDLANLGIKISSVKELLRRLKNETR